MSSNTTLNPIFGQPTYSDVETKSVEPARGRSIIGKSRTADDDNPKNKVYVTDAEKAASFVSNAVAGVSASQHARATYGSTQTNQTRIVRSMSNLTLPLAEDVKKSTKTVRIAIPEDSAKTKRTPPPSPK